MGGCYLAGLIPLLLLTVFVLGANERDSVVSELGRVAIVQCSPAQERRGWIDFDWHWLWLFCIPNCLRHRVRVKREREQGSKHRRALYTKCLEFLTDAGTIMLATPRNFKECRPQVRTARN